MLQQIFFALVTLMAFSFAFNKYAKIYRNINLGGDYDTSGNGILRMKNLFLIAFGQKKMFKRMVPAIMHLFIYVAFLLTQIELLEIFSHVIFANKIIYIM